MNGISTLIRVRRACPCSFKSPAQEDTRRQPSANQEAGSHRSASRTLRNTSLSYSVYGVLSQQPTLKTVCDVSSFSDCPQDFLFSFDFQKFECEVSRVCFCFDLLIYYQSGWWFSNSFGLRILSVGEKCLSRAFCPSHSGDNSSYPYLHHE